MELPIFHDECSTIVSVTSLRWSSAFRPATGKKLRSAVQSNSVRLLLNDFRLTLVFLSRFRFLILSSYFTKSISNQKIVFVSPEALLFSRSPPSFFFVLFISIFFLPIPRDEFLPLSDLFCFFFFFFYRIHLPFFVLSFSPATERLKINIDLDWN